MKLTPINPHFNACDQKWELMPEQDGGRLCDTCERVLVDFTPYTEQEVLNQQRANDFKVCGRYTRGQVDRLHRHLTLEETQNYRPWLVSLAMSLGSLLPMGAAAQNTFIPVGDITLTTDSSAFQPTNVVVDSMKPKSLDNEEVVLDTLNIPTNLTVPMPGVPGDVRYPLLDVTDADNEMVELKGTVKDAETGETIPFASVWIEVTKTGTTADFDGNFLLKVPLSYGKVKLITSFIGYENDTSIIELVSKKSNELNLIALETNTQLVGFVVVTSSTTYSVGRKLRHWSNPANWYRRIRNKIRYR